MVHQTLSVRIFPSNRRRLLLVYGSVTVRAAISTKTLALLGLGSLQSKYESSGRGLDDAVA